MSIEALIQKWEARSLGATPADAMLINKHCRELREAYSGICADAERYRWIRSTTSPGYLTFPNGEIQDGLALGALDNAIDAAMRANARLKRPLADTRSGPRRDVPAVLLNQ